MGAGADEVGVWVPAGPNMKTSVLSSSADGTVSFSQRPALRAETAPPAASIVAARAGESTLVPRTARGAAGMAKPMQLTGSASRDRTRCIGIQIADTVIDLA